MATSTDNRKKQRQQLYNTIAWRKLSLLYRSEHPMCERCNEHFTEAVHHIHSPFDYGLSKAEAYRRLLDPDNLMAVCTKCHQEIHEELEEKKKEAKKASNEKWYIRY